jgi:hypothetical protein
MRRRGGRNESVIGGAARNRAIGHPENELLVGLHAQAQQRQRKSRRKEVANDHAGGSMGRGETGENGVRLERAVLDQPQTAVERFPRAFMPLVP